MLEAPIKAMALAAIEGNRTDTLYIGTAGGMGPATLKCLQQELTALSFRPGGMVIAASDADPAGERYAVRIGDLGDGGGTAEPASRTCGMERLGRRPEGWCRPVTGSSLQAIERSGDLCSKPYLQPTQLPGPAPWMPKAIAMGERVAAIEHRSAMMAAERLAQRNGRIEPRIEQPRPSIGMGPSS